jgi:hypothetical protein
MRGRRRRRRRGRRRKKKNSLRALKDRRPAPLWKFIVDHRDIFEAHVLLSGKLNRSDLKMFYGYVERVVERL